MNRRLFIQILLPLAVATVVAIAVHLRWPADGFFLNLAAGFVGSLITVGYIDWILRRHDSERWKEADTRISARLSYVATITITGIRTAFGYGTEVFDQRIMNIGDQTAMQSEVLRIAAHVVAPTAETRVAAMDQEQWKSFVTNLMHASAECGVILDRFGHRLAPRTVATLLDLQEALTAAQTYWRVFPDVAGVPVDQVPTGRTPPDELQAVWCEFTARDVRKAIALAIQLVEQGRNE